MIVNHAQLIYNRAIINIKKKIKLVLLTERFDESILLLKKLYGLNRPYYYQYNTKITKKGLADFTNEQIEFIKSRDGFDFQLYEEVKKLFEEKLNENFKNVNNELKKYRHKNNFFGSMFYLLDHISPIPIFSYKTMLSVKYKRLKSSKYLNENHIK